MPYPPFRIVLLGAFAPAESAQVVAALSLLPDTARVVRSTVLTDDWPRRAADSNLCIVFENWPDEIPATTAHALIAACSTGRLICCQGAWCASAGRSRAVWPPGVTVPVELLASRIAFELAVLSGDHPPLPATASRDEAFAAHYAPAPAGSSVSARVDSPDSVYARELQRALSSDATKHTPECTLVDADRAEHGDNERAARSPITLAGFARPAFDRPRAATARATVIPKLAPLSELRAAVTAAINGTGKPGGVRPGS